MFRLFRTPILAVCLVLALCMAFCSVVSAANDGGVSKIGGKRGLWIGQGGLQFTEHEDVPSDERLVDGRVYYDTTDGLYVYHAAAWVSLQSTTTSTADTIYNNGWAVSVDDYDVGFDLDALDVAVKIYANITGAQTAMLVLDAEHANSAVVDALKITTLGSSAAITDAIDVSDAGIVNAINLGDNVLLGAACSINTTYFDVDATGAMTDVGAITTDGVLTLSGAAADIAVNSTMFTVDATQGNTVVAGTLGVTGTTTVADFVSTGSATIANWAIAAVTSPTNLTLDGTTTGTVTVGGASTGIVWLGDNSGGATQVTVGDGTNMTIGEGSLTIDDDVDEVALAITGQGVANSTVTVVSTATTTGDVVSITADALLSSGAMVYLESSTLPSGAFYLECNDGTNQEFLIGTAGAATWLGAASTDIITVMAGDIQVTTGDIDVDNGNLMVDTTGLLTSNISRNNASASGAAVLTVVDTHASSTAAAMSIYQSGTGASTGLGIYHAGDDPALELTATAARTGDVIAIPMANQLGEMAINISGAITGTAGEGTISVGTTGNLAQNACLQYMSVDSGVTIAGATDGFMLDIQDESVAVGTSYAVEIDSTFNEALKVTTGNVLIADTLTVTTSVISSTLLDNNGTYDQDTATANPFDLTSSLATASTAMRVYNSNGTISAQNYLLALDFADDGDANGDYLICRDNTGADEKFKISQDGDVAIAGAVTMTGGTLTLTAGHIAVDIGTDAASAGELDIVAGTQFDITGTTNITSIAAADSIAGRIIILKFDAILTFTDGNNLKLAGNLVTTADDTITLFCDGTDWWEMARSVN